MRVPLRHGSPPSAEPGSSRPLRAPRPLGLAYRFALVYRARAGLPAPPAAASSRRADLGLPFESTDRPVRRRRPAGLVHPGARRRARARASSSSTAGSRPATGRCPMALFLHAAGFHCLTFDVRGHGANPPETLPLSAGEFGDDALAAFDALLARPEVTAGGDLRPLDGRASGRSSPRRRTRASRPSSRRPPRPTRTGSRARRSGSRACRSPTRSPIRWPG